MDQAKLHNSINRLSKTTKENLLKRRTIILVFPVEPIVLQLTGNPRLSRRALRCPSGRLAAEAPGTVTVPEFACTYVSS
jgi:hypothetical protein